MIKLMQSLEPLQHTKSLKSAHFGGWQTASHLLKINLHQVMRIRCETLLVIQSYDKDAVTLDFIILTVDSAIHEFY